MERYQHEKIVRIIITVMVALFAIYAGIQISNDLEIKKVDLSKNSVYDSSDNFNFHIDKVSFRDDGIKNTEEKIIISGFLTKTGESISTASISIVLKNCSTGEFYRVPTLMSNRTDVTEAYGDGNNYDPCGFSAKISKNNKINPDIDDYEIMAIYTLNGKKKLVSSGTTIQTWSM